MPFCWIKSRDVPNSLTYSIFIRTTIIFRLSEIWNCRLSLPFMAGWTFQTFRHFIDTSPMFLSFRYHTRSDCPCWSLAHRPLHAGDAVRLDQGRERALTLGDACGILSGKLEGWKSGKGQ